MGTMQSWLPARGSGRFVLRALPFVVAIMVHAQYAPQYAQSFEGSLTVLPFESGSTLDAYVPAQDLDLQKTVLDFVDSGILVGRKQPQAPKPTTPTEAASQPQVGQKSLQRSILKKPTSKSTNNSAANSTANSVEPKKSPFRKWVKPQTSEAAAPREVAKTKGAKTKGEATVPKVARIPSKPLLLNPAMTAPKPVRKRRTTAASDRSTRSEEKTAEPKKASPIPQAKTTAKTATAKTKTPPVTATPSATTPTKNLPPLTTSQANLRKKIRGVLTHYYNRPMNTRDRSPWELMHAMLAFEAHSKVLQGGPNGDPITAVGWLCYNQECKRRTLMYVDDDGKLQVRVGPALQGHRGQLLAMLAQSRINVNYPLLVEDHKLEVADLIEMEKRTCYPRTELTFKLIALMHYLDSDATWINDQGMEWNIPRLISEEIRQPVRGAACGGTHRLGGLTLAYKTREKRGEPVDGQYLKAKQFVTRYQQYAYRQQNRDGSFSTEWFRGPGNEDDIDRKLKTTGHILEWLLYASGEKELKHWKTTKAVNYLASIMERNRYKDWEAGPLGHAIHALLVYDRLVFAPYDDSPGESILAEKTLSTQQGTKQASRPAPRQPSRRSRRNR